MRHPRLLISTLLLALVPALAHAQTAPQAPPPQALQPIPPEGSSAKSVLPPPNFSATKAKPTDGKPEVTAMAYGPIALGSRFETQASEDTEVDHEALERVNAVLAEHGYGVGENAPYVMVVEADLVRSDRQDEPLGHASGTNNEARIEGRLFSTSQTSLLNPTPTLDNSDRTYRISVSVYDRASGLYVWRGSANRSDPNLDVNQASSEMVSALLTHLGKTVK